MIGDLNRALVANTQFFELQEINETNRAEDALNKKHPLLAKLGTDIENLANLILNTRNAAKYKILGNLWIANYAELLNTLDLGIHELRAIKAVLIRNPDDPSVLERLLQLHKPEITTYSSKMMLGAMLSLLTASLATISKSPQQEDETNHFLSETAIVCGMCGSIGLLTNHLLNMTLLNSLNAILAQFQQLITTSHHLYTHARTGYFN